MKFFNLHDDIGNDLYIHKDHALERLDKYHYTKMKQGEIKATAIVCYFCGDETWELMQEMIVNCEQTILQSTHYSFHKDKEIQCFMAVEGLCGIKDEVEEKIAWLYEHHVRMATLCWNDENALACGAKSGNKHLTPLGIECVHAMNQHHMIIDVSHCCELNFYDILSHSSEPVIATHCNPKGYYEHFRNLNDEQMKALKNQGGIMGLLPLTWFMCDNKVNEPIDTFIEVIDYAVSLLGYESIAFGFDFMDYLDDAGGMVEGMHNVSMIQNLIPALKKHGYSDTYIKAMAYENAERFMNEYLKEA